MDGNGVRTRGAQAKSPFLINNGGVFTPSAEYEAVNRRRLGRPPPSNSDNEIVDNGVVHDLNMGYYTRNTMSPHSPIGFHQKEHEFYHPWSLESSGEEYAYAKLGDMLPIKDFITLPNVVVEAVLAGMIKGQERRFNDTKDKEPKAEDIEAILKKSGLTPEQMKLIKGMTGKP